MALAPFFDRTFSALERSVRASRATLEALLAERAVLVQCGPLVDVPGNPRWIAELVVNLLARLYPTIFLEGSAAVTDEFSRLARSINQDINVASRGAVPAATIAIGQIGSDVPSAIYPSASGWVGRVTYGAGPATPGVPNPYAAAVAAGFAVAEVFRTVFADHLTIDGRRPLSVSLLDYGESTGVDLELPKADLGQVIIAGLGAVGNGAIWALGRHRTLTGNVRLVDGERVDRGNLQRYVLALAKHERTWKTKLAHEALSSTSLTITQHRETLEVLAGKLVDDSAMETVCISVDNRGGRRAAQALLPRRVINGWTGEQALGVSWHEFDDDHPCLACLYQPRACGKSETDMLAEEFGLSIARLKDVMTQRGRLSEDDLTAVAAHLGVERREVDMLAKGSIFELRRAVVCGGVHLPRISSDDDNTVPLSHQSLLAGALMAAELVKRCSPELRALSQPERMIIINDITGLPPRRWATRRQPAPGCICRDPIYRRVYREKWPGLIAAREQTLHVAHRELPPQPNAQAVDGAA